jgi:hypothetical protein
MYVRPEPRAVSQSINVISNNSQKGLLAVRLNPYFPGVYCTACPEREKSKMFIESKFKPSMAEVIVVLVVPVPSRMSIVRKVKS